MTDSAEPEYLQSRECTNGRIALAEPDPAWATQYAREEQRIRTALEPQECSVDHVGSTSIPGLLAKPTLDIVLVVADSADEAAYVPDLEAIGYVLHAREPGWYAHRLLTRQTPDVNLHVFSTGCPEVERMLFFRDFLRAHPEERDAYERTKRELAAARWTHVEDYANAKTAVVEETIAKARKRGW